MPNKPIISEETFYDEDAQLYYCYIGLDDKKKTLLLTVWGKTEKAVRDFAEILLPVI